MPDTRPKVVQSKTKRIKLGCGNLYVTVSHKDGKLYEVFCNMGKSGGCLMSNVDALSIAITMGLRDNVPQDVYIEKLYGIKCQVYSLDDGEEYFSCADAIAKFMKEVETWLHGKSL
ncbi:MAG: hypothetical protein WCY09_08780 [Candidatus Omnitrophota bacterium]|jgi:ribonucleoside-diphosphate reductase alpha chain